MNLSHKELLALQNRIEKVGKDAFIKEEFRLRGVVVRKRQKIKDFTDDNAKASYIADRKKEDEVRSELRTLMLRRRHNHEVRAPLRKRLRDT